MKASENPVSLHIFVSVCISICAHVYISSCIHELLIVLMLTEKASWFGNILLVNNMASGSTDCACA